MDVVLLGILLADDVLTYLPYRTAARICITVEYTFFSPEDTHIITPFKKQLSKVTVTLKGSGRNNSEYVLGKVDICSF